MAGTKISDLPSASTLTGAELVPVVQSDVTKKTTVADILASPGIGTVTSVNVSGGTTGLTATGGPITTTGTITLGGTLDVDNGGTGATTASGARSNLGAAASGANSDITSLTGVTGGISSPDFVQFDTAAGATTAVAKQYWEDNSGGLSYGMKGGNVTQNIGQQVYQRVYNNTGSTIAKGSVVYVTGSSGTRTTVAKALATSDGTSSSVIGITAEAISNNSEGFVITEGELSGVSTSGIGDGEVLWLSATTAGAFTDVKTVAPNHLVLVGYCVKGNSVGGGIIYVKMENGYEIGELHDVYVSSPSNGQTLLYNATNSRWENHNLTAGSGITITNGAGSVTIAATGGGGSGTVTSVDASGGTTGLTFSGGPITTSGTLTLSGTLDLDNGGTGATTAAGARTAILPSYSGNAGKVLTVNPGATDVQWNTVSGTGTVTSVDVSGGTTGLSFTGGPITAAGTITASGTLAVANGGTGQTSYTNGQLLIGNTTGNTLTKSTLTAGSGITITNGAGSITIAATGGGSGDVIGPASATDNAVARFDGTTGKLIKDTSNFIIDGSNNVGIGGTTSSDTKVNISGVLPVSGTGYSYAFGNRGTVASTVTNPATGVLSELNTQASGLSYTVGTYYHFAAKNGALGSNSVVNNQVGYWAEDFTLGQAVFGYISSVNAGTNKWGLYFSGDAKNYFKGNVGIGNGNDNPGSALDVKGTIRLSGSTSGYVGLAPAAAAGSTTYTLPSADGTSGQVLKTDGAGTLSWTTAGSGTVTSVNVSGGSTGLTFSGGPVTSSGTITAAGTLGVGYGGTGLTSGTSGGVLYYSASGTLASSSALAANALVIGGGAGTAPSTITTGTGVVTALGINTGSAGAFVVNGGALGTPSSGTLTNATGLPLSTGVTGTLGIANGGTGLTSTPTNGQIDIGNGTGFTRTTITAGSNITVTNGAGSITIASTGVSTGKSISMAMIFGF